MQRRYLISRLTAMGDVVCTLPAAGALKAGFPDCEVHWVVDARYAALVRGCRFVDRTISIASRWELLRKELGGPFDAALDLQGLLKSAIPVLRARARSKLGFHWQREGAWLVSQRVLPDPTSLHVVDQYVDVARALGGVAGRAEFGLEPDPEALESVKSKLKDRGAPDRFLAVNPSSAWPSKRWPPAHFASLVDGLAGAGIAPVLIGANSPVDLQIAREIVDLCKENPTLMTGQTSVAELVGLLFLSAGHVGGDTGSTHIAAALGKPAIGLYSATNPERTCPYGQIRRCVYDPEGIGNILPNAVMELVCEALS